MEVRTEAVVQTPTTLATSHASLGTIVRAVLAPIVAAGVATAVQNDADTLDDRLLEERRRAKATFISDMMFGAWARTPS